MVPENQDVFLQLLGHAEFNYLAQAYDVPKDVWQPFCHHGAGYALRIGDAMNDAKKYSEKTDRMVVKDNKGNKVDGKGWAVFYWRLRYCLVAAGPKSFFSGYSAATLKERFSFLDEAKALDF